jgi:hypothetical protein
MEEKTWNNYLSTYDLYSPMLNVLDACISITRVSGKGVGPWKSRVFWALGNGNEPIGVCQIQYRD